MLSCCQEESRNISSVFPHDFKKHFSGCFEGRRLHTSDLNLIQWTLCLCCRWQVETQAAAVTLVCLKKADVFVSLWSVTHMQWLGVSAAPAGSDSSVWLHSFSGSKEKFPLSVQTWTLMFNYKQICCTDCDICTITVDS